MTFQPCTHIVTAIGRIQQTPRGGDSTCHVRNGSSGFTVPRAHGVLDIVSKWCGCPSLQFEKETSTTRSFPTAIACSGAKLRHKEEVVAASAFFSSFTMRLFQNVCSISIKGLIPGGFRPRLPHMITLLPCPSSQSNALLRRTSPKDVDDLDADLSEQVLEASYRMDLTECRGSDSGSTEENRSRSIACGIITLAVATTLCSEENLCRVHCSERRYSSPNAAHTTTLRAHRL